MYIILKIKAAFQDDPQGKEFVFNGLTGFLVSDNQSEAFIDQSEALFTSPLPGSLPVFRRTRAIKS